jgi:hypothetical protein
MERSVDREDRIQDSERSVSEDTRKHIPSRDRDYRLSNDDLRILKTVSVFRAVDTRDIPSKKLKNLIDSGLVEKHVVHTGRKGTGRRNRLEVLTATREGLAVLAAMRPIDDLQRLHSGLVKKNELEHDTAIYPVYLEQAKEIESAGGRVKRVILDYEMKSIVNREMNKKQGPTLEKRREILAKDLGLEIVDGKLPLPDVRIEYVDEYGAERHRDVEVTTAHYRGSHMAAKVKSGFTIVSASKIGVVRDRMGGVPSDDHRLRVF